MSPPTVDYFTMPLELMTVADLTDALGVDRAAAILNTSKRAIYTVRHTNGLGAERIMTLIDAVRTDETTCRQRLVVTRNAKALRTTQG